MYRPVGVQVRIPVQVQAEGRKGRGRRKGGKCGRWLGCRGMTRCGRAHMLGEVLLASHCPSTVMGSEWKNRQGGCELMR